MKSKKRKKVVESLNRFISAFDIIPFDDEAALIYGKIRTDLEKKRCDYWTE
jgi:predicted nucleic acid-binding protein